MNVLSQAMKYAPLALQALEIAYDYAKQKIDERELARRAVDLAVATGVEARDLTVMLEDSAAAAAEVRLRARQQATYGESEP